jgi:hypothetical protein
MRTIARDLKHMPELTGEDTKGLDRLEEKESLKKDGGDYVASQQIRYTG